MGEITNNNVCEKRENFLIQHGFNDDTCFTCNHCGRLLSVDVPYFALERAGRADPYYFCRDCAHFIGALMKKELIPKDEHR